MRKDVISYYNDQIMDNLIRAYNRLPFVHVDITLLTSQGGSQITGTIGAGESRTSTNTSKSMAGALGTIANAVTRPFADPVTPQQTETLTISTAPALGNQAVAAQEQTQSPKVQITKWTGKYGNHLSNPVPNPVHNPVRRNPICRNPVRRNPVPNNKENDHFREPTNTDHHLRPL